MVMNEKLKQRFELVVDFFNQNGRMPTYKEMMKLFGVSSKNAVFKVIGRLESLGLVKRQDTHIVLKSSYRGLKLLGSIEAGFPSPAEEELLDSVSIDKLLVKNPNSSFLLKVSGDSMINAGIMPGDFVIVDKSLNACENDIVIAQVDGKWTIKYLTKENGSFILTAANPKYKPIKPKYELIVAGVVVGVARKYK